MKTDFLFTKMTTVSKHMIRGNIKFTKVFVNGEVRRMYWEYIDKEKCIQKNPIIPYKTGMGERGPIIDLVFIIESEYYGAFYVLHKIRYSRCTYSVSRQRRRAVRNQVVIYLVLKWKRNQ